MVRRYDILGRSFSNIQHLLQSFGLSLMAGQQTLCRDMENRDLEKSVGFNCCQSIPSYYCFLLICLPNINFCIKAPVSTFHVPHCYTRGLRIFEELCLEKKGRESQIPGESPLWGLSLQENKRRDGACRREGTGRSKEGAFERKKKIKGYERKTEKSSR